MKTIEELITELLFADDCALLANSEEALQHIVKLHSTYLGNVISNDATVSKDLDN